MEERAKQAGERLHVVCHLLSQLRLAGAPSEMGETDSGCTAQEEPTATGERRSEEQEGSQG